jgi:hypothetical protein
MESEWNAKKIADTQLIIERVMSGAERRAMSKFFSDVESTREDRDRLRAALVTSTIDAELLTDLRYFFNFLKDTGEVIPYPQVRAAIRIAQGQA